MNNVFLHTNAIENRMFIKDITLDYYGNEMLKIGFKYHKNMDDSMMIIRVSERKKYHAFPGTLSMN